MPHYPPYGSSCQMLVTLKRTCRQCNNPESVTVPFAGGDSYDEALAQLGGDGFLCEQCLEKENASEGAFCSSLSSDEDQPRRARCQDGAREYTRTTVNFHD